jgi:AcrR family transcriptional regulator
VESEPVRRRRLTQAEAREQTRRQLLAAAAEVFGRKGFAGASLEEIADLAGYTTGAVYYHFGNKDKLFLELIETGWSRQNAAWVRALTKVFAPPEPGTADEGQADPDGAESSTAEQGPADPDAADRDTEEPLDSPDSGSPADSAADPYAGLARAVVARAARRAESAPLAGEFWLYALRNPAGMAIVAEKLREQIDGLSPVLGAAMERTGTPPGITPEEMTTVALALFQGLARRRAIDPASVPDDLYARVLRRLMEP